MNRLPIIREFMELVEIDVASKNERVIADVVTKKLKDIGCLVYEDNTGEKIGGNTGNLFAILEGTREGALLFSAHLDRVANGIGIKPKIVGSKIVSNGTILSADDVSGIAAILDGLRKVVNSKKSHPRIEILLTVCEEKGVSGSKYVDYSQIKSKIAFVLDSPGRIGRVINAAPSKASLNFEVVGKSAHAGNFPEKGVNSLVTAAKVLSRIKDGRIDEITTANWASIESLSPTNVVNS
ncbi:M28 family peptidase, partial [Cetobacterium sp.]